MLQIKNLSITHKKDFRVLLKDFSFVINSGDKAVIIGEEGNGKSTLLKWIYAPDMIETYADAQGERICTGETLGYLAQELPEEEKEKTVYEFFSSENCFWDLTPKELTQLAGQIHLSLDFFYSDQIMRTLSGGEKVKAQMARLLIAKPTMLLLDEPSNDIDIETLEWLEQLKRKTESCYTVARLSYRRYLEERSARLINQEQQALNERREERKRQEKFRRIQQKVEYDLNSITRQDPHGGYLLKKKMKAVKSLEKRYEREAQDMTQRPETEDAIFFKIGESVRMTAGKTVLEFSLDRLMTPEADAEAMQDGADLRQPAEQTGTKPRLLAQNIFLRIKGGERVCIIGQNGIGKTTLLKRIARELLARQDIRVCYMPQNYEELLDMEKTPVAYLTVSGDREESTRIRTWLGSLKFTADEMCHPISELSGGQKAKVLLLRMSLSDADVLILDEPTRNFSLCPVR